MGEQNVKRVRRVGQAIEAVPAFKQSYEEGGAHQAGKDLLCNLMHWFADHGEDFDDALEAARDLYDGEVEDDE